MMVSVMTPETGLKSSDRPASTQMIAVMRFHQKPGAARPDENTATMPMAPPSSRSQPHCKPDRQRGDTRGRDGEQAEQAHHDAVDDEPGAVIAQRSGIGGQSDWHENLPCSTKAALGGVFLRVGKMVAHAAAP